MSEDKQVKKTILCSAFFVITLVGLVVLIASLLTGCTLAFTNISTHGTATDVVDDNQTASPNVSPNIAIPVKPL